MFTGPAEAVRWGCVLRCFGVCASVFTGVTGDFNVLVVGCVDNLGCAVVTRSVAIRQKCDFGEKPISCPYDT